MGCLKSMSLLSLVDGLDLSITKMYGECLCRD